MYVDCLQVCFAGVYRSVCVNEAERGDAILNASIEELEQTLSVERRKLSEYQRELERLKEKKPIVEKNIVNVIGRIQDFEASIFILKNMEENSEWI